MGKIPGKANVVQNVNDLIENLNDLRKKNTKRKRLVCSVMNSCSWLVHARPTRALVGTDYDTPEGPSKGLNRPRTVLASL